MSTKREPLLSDELINYSCFSNVMATSREREIAKNAMEDVRSMYEAARTKDAELIQKLVDALKDAETTAIACREILPYAMDRPEQRWNKAVQDVIGVNIGNIEQMQEALSSAAAQGFKPSEP
jgi:hypothetical protein